MKSTFPAFTATLLAAATLFAAPEPIPLWPSGAPGEKGELPAEADTTKPTDGQVAGRRVMRIGNVSNPTITIFSPPKEKDTGTAVLVCPGGGYNILALDLEGTEVCDWLNSIGVTGVLLKYRVPRRPGLPPHAAPLQDAQRAMGVVRQRASEFGIDPKRIGVLGFSAGGHLAATLSNNYDTRTYPKLDAADEQSCRPDFIVLVYTAYLTVKDEGDKLAPEMRVTAQTPPTFLVQTEDDSVRVETGLFYYLALKNAKVSAELHIYPTGGHGYGLRPGKDFVTTWPQRAADWMKGLGVLEPKP
jgi:acetyl esterase/lipase